MMADEHHYVYTGEDDPPEDVTHVRIHASITVIPEGLFNEHPNIIELICHDGVIKIEAGAFWNCPRLKRAVMPGVEEVEVLAFFSCEALEHIECKQLEVIRYRAFSHCASLESIDLPSAMIIEDFVFPNCVALIDVKFGENLESIGQKALCKGAVKRITIPLKSGLFTHDDVFICCEDFGQVCLIDEATIQETVDALLLDEWKNDVNEELGSINRTLPNVDAGEWYYNGSRNVENVGEKTRTIREWIKSVLQRIIHFKVEHYRLLSLAAAVLAHVSPNEIVIDSVLSFLQLPDHVFEGEGDTDATTPALDRQLWENVVKMEQRRIEMENFDRLEQKLLEQGREIAALKALNDEKEDENHQLKLRVAQLELQVAEFGGAINSEC